MLRVILIIVFMVITAILGFVITFGLCLGWGIYNVLVGFQSIPIDNFRIVIGAIQFLATTIVGTISFWGWMIVNTLFVQLIDEYL